MGQLADCQSGSWQSASGGGGIGYGQTWQDVTASRALNTTYTNNTGKPITLSIIMTGGYGGEIIAMEGIPMYTEAWYTTGYDRTIQTIVPVGSTYSLTPNNGYIKKWLELR